MPSIAWNHDRMGSVVDFTLIVPCLCRMKSCYSLITFRIVLFAYTETFHRPSRFEQPE